MVGQWPLKPLILVRLQVPQPRSEVSRDLRASRNRLTIPNKAYLLSAVFKTKNHLHGWFFVVLMYTCVMDKKLRHLLEKTLQVTTPLAQAAASHDTKFLNVLLGIYRVSFSTLRDIYYLSSNEESGASALDLTRKVIEYGIAVEYMLWKGKEKMAEQFQEHLDVEMHHTLEFLKSIGQDLESQSTEFRTGVENAESRYLSLNSHAKERKNWAGLAVDKMIETLHAAGKLRDFDFSRIGEAYIWECRLNHVSPFVVRNYMGSEDGQIASDFYMRQAIMFAMLFHLRLATRYVDEIRTLSSSNVYPELAASVLSILDELERLKPE
ncbi:MAG: hypothetical protein UY44_C0001G0001 [Candidatus Kaiserbacteria bacterium GW2011_GWA2_49_19]|uniref:Uncharacterized protein n=1 Tax=Candidatus Kaiserbacteria bacterium GW2011_GWA2_49_19 TaxID=1618669 RepID=A0A0G1VSJ0_9BACT|nr:MAG: hypothetical protein UY44_C0001G0001 [Candidatus Kaiserbacteria bacterium GW2011_GWA2_49_19]